ncbi:esterase-like activity of phytase family protein [Ottowia testudinis]|uniref:Esterase-like activity of phytase family protein n=1 Tax=Ottowia testudinis TaxID=2816950 RepID=A0A975CM47_9BURK|nr:esterase-like activity of phytase family protein [Ottowia testudinis]QTD46709.1 esterase-like activity of phytase family protein [Ottowia testudinis]
MSLHRIPLSIALCAALPVGAQQAFPATLTGHAALPARTFAPAPKNAPDSLRTSGKYTAPHGRRVDQLESIAGTSYLSAKDAPRPTGISLPFAGQPVQGFSGIKSVGQGRYWVLTDNGFGAKANSADAMLMFHEVEPDWKTGQVKRHQTVFLHDPDRKVPFLIVNEGTRERYLTGADFDPESIQFIGHDVWIGDELGPYLVKADRQGKVLAVFETQVDGKPARSPDHYAVTTPATPGAFATNIRRSRGYEGMAASKDGRFLYPLLEGPMWVEATKQWEMKDGREYLRMLEFDVQKGEWTGRSWKYLLEANGNNIGDFNMIDADTGLIIERDNGEGLAATACNGPARAHCQNVPARFKRVYKVSLKDADADGFVRKIGYVDLLDINDPKAVARVGGDKGKFTFPFVTIENVDVVDAEHIIVANDNNLPYSAGRQLGKNDDNEFILLHVPELLKAK